LLEGENLTPGHPFLNDRRGVWHLRPVAAIEILGGLGFRQAIQAAEITAVSQAYPQITQHPPMRINQELRSRHFGGSGAAAVLVIGGMTLTEPSALTSTFRS